MRREAYLIPFNAQQNRERMLEIVLAKADTFIGYFGKGGTLATGRQEFTRFQSAAIRPWAGVRDAVSVEVRLTDKIRRSILQFERMAPPGRQPALWTYDLMLEGEPILYVQDSDVFILYANLFEMRRFRQAGFEVDLWERVEISESELSLPDQDPETIVDQLRDEIDALLGSANAA